MTRARRPAVRSRLPLLALGGALLLAGCGSGQNAQTYQPKAAADSSDVTIGDLAVRDISVSAPKSGTVLAQGSDAPMTITVVDNGNQPDVLLAAQSPAASSVDVVTRASATASGGPGSFSAANPTPGDTAGPSSSPSPSDTASPGATASPSDTASPTGTAAGATLAVPAGGTTGEQYSLVLRGLTAPLDTGTYIQVTLTFQRNGTRTVTVPVAVTDSDTTLSRPSGYKVPDEDSAGNAITQ